MSHPKLTADQIADLKRMIADGIPRIEIAEAFGVSVSAVTYHAIQGGYATRGEQAPPDAPPTFVRVDDEPWRDDALCAQTDPESFFPDKGGSTKEAKAVCATCLVAAECLDWAIAHDERFGIWGGLSERERRRLKQQLNTIHLDSQQEPA